MLPILAACCLYFSPLLPPVQASPAINSRPVYHIPYILTATKHLMIRAKLNGQGPYNFIVDTGAPALYLATAVAKEIGLKAGKDQWGVVDRLEVEGGPILHKTRVRLEDPHQITGMNQMGLLSTRLDGIFGYDILARFRIEIDLTKTSMVWTRLDYQPLAPVSLLKLAGKKPLKGARGLAEMEQLTKIAGAMFARKAVAPIPRGFIGVELAESGEGAGIRSVLPSGPAARAGLAAGDRITQVQVPGADPRLIKTPGELIRAAAEIAPGDLVLFTIVRDGATRQISVQAAKGAL